MSLATRLPDHLSKSFDLYTELAAQLDEASLQSRLPGLPSNPIALQLWCVVGARESHARAIRTGGWTGFSCSLDEPGRKESLLPALRESAAEIMELLDGVGRFDCRQSGWILDLLEHEAAHQGQLIRYLYGLRLPIPLGWQQRYHLSPLAEIGSGGGPDPVGSGA